MFKKAHTKWIYLIKNTFTASLCHHAHRTIISERLSDATNTGCTVHDALYAIGYPGPVFNHLAYKSISIKVQKYHCFNAGCRRCCVLYEIHGLLQAQIPLLQVPIPSYRFRHCIYTWFNIRCPGSGQICLSLLRNESSSFSILKKWSGTVTVRRDYFHHILPQESHGGKLTGIYWQVPEIRLPSPPKSPPKVRKAFMGQEEGGFQDPVND